MKQILTIITHRKIPPWLIITAIIIVAAALRFYRLSETILFASDQGLDMVGIWLVKKTGNFPLVGPFLTMPDVHTPPTYYLINWAMYSLTQSVTKVVYGYALINLLTILILTKLAHEMMGTRAAIFTSLLLAVSSVMIDHSRTFWNPYPIQFFLALSLLFFWWTYTTKHVLFLWTGVLCYQVALSIYPSPILLAPFVGYHIFRWYRQDAQKTRLISALFTLLTFGTTFAMVFSPQLIYEATHGFPTIANSIHADASGHSLHPVISVIQNAYFLTTMFFATNRLPQLPMITITIALCALYILLIYLTRAKRLPLIHTFFPLWTFVIGFCAFLFYPYEVHHHRNTALLPFMFLLTAYLLSRAWLKGSAAKIVAAITLLILIGLNVYGAQWYWSGTATNSLDLTKSVARFIESDMEKRGITDISAGFFYKIPNDPDNGSYGIYRILFWLLRDAGLSFRLDAKNIHLPHDYSTPVLKPYMYIICRGFTSQQIINEQCVSPVIQTANYRRLTQKTFENITVVVLSGGIISEAPYTTP